MNVRAVCLKSVMGLIAWNVTFAKAHTTESVGLVAFSYRTKPLSSSWALGKTGWVCIYCRVWSSSKFKELQWKVAMLVEEVTSLRNDLSEVTKQQQRSAANNKNAATATDVTDHEDGTAAIIPANKNTDICSTVEIVHRTLADVSRRKRNVIVVGMRERDDDNADFFAICRENLPVKSSVTDDGHKNWQKFTYQTTFTAGKA